MNDKTDLLAELKIERGVETQGPGISLGWIVLLAVLLLAGGSLAWVLTRDTQWPVEIERAIALPAKQVASVLDASGYVTARRLATVSSKVTGKVLEVRIEEGMKVEEGQVLAVLDDASVRADMELAKAQLDAARTSLDEIRVLRDDASRTLGRTRDLRARNLASEADLDAAQASVDAHEARLAAGNRDVVVSEKVLAVQQQRMDDTIIRAPFSGVVIAKAAQPGEMISPVSAGGGFTRTGIGTVVDMASLEIEVDVNESYIQRVHEQQQVTATLDAYPDWKIPASVIAIIPTADRQKATVKVRIRFDQLDGRILPDMGVKVSFHTDQPDQGQQQQPGVLVSESAIRRDQGNDIVYRVEDGVARRRAVTTAGKIDGRLVIAAGLAVGDLVIVQPPDELNDGDAIVDASKQ